MTRSKASFVLSVMALLFVGYSAFFTAHAHRPIVILLQCAVAILASISLVGSLLEMRARRSLPPK